MNLAPQANPLLNGNQRQSRVTRDLTPHSEVIHLPNKQPVCKRVLPIHDIALRETLTQSLKLAEKRRQRSFIYNRLQTTRMPNSSRT